MAKKNVISTFQIFGELQKVFTEKLKTNNCSHDFVFLFAGQKPISAVLLIEGAIEIDSGKKIIQIQGRNILLLHEEFTKSKSVKSSVRILSGSIFCWADKAMIEALLKSDAITSVSTSR